MSDERVRLVIDGREVETRPGTLLVDAAAQAGIDIPVFCYHPKLDPAGVCRMCLVEVEGVPKPVTACTTPVRDGMVVHTQSERTKTLQRGVLEFLLINHPLDCPVCDKGGECPLQDNTYRYGPAVSRMFDGKMRKRKAVDLGPFIVLDEERCILCRRCTRFDDTVAAEGNLILGLRGYQTVVTTATGKRYDSYYSGNTTELCPVGALTSEAYRFQARPWDLSPVPSVCTGCSLGCNVRLDFRFGELKRVMSRDNLLVDGGWLCDRGRYNFKYIDSSERVTQPLVRKNGEFVPVSWAEAMQVIGQRLREIRRDFGGESIGLVGGGRLTNEAAYLFQKLGRAVLGTPHIDHRSGAQMVASSRDYPGRVTDLDSADVIIIVDVQLQERIPVLDLRVRRALERRKAKVVLIGPAPQRYRGPAVAAVVPPGETPAALRQLRAALRAGDQGEGKAAEGASPSGPLAGDLVASLAEAVASARKVVVVWGGAGREAGRELLHFLDAARGCATGHDDSNGTGAPGGRAVSLLIPGEQANSRGAELMGVRPDSLPGYRSVHDDAARRLLEQHWQVKLPRQAGWNTGRMLAAAAAGELKAMIIAGANLVLTYPDGQLARQALENLSFLVVQDLFLTDTARLAHVVLPAAQFTAAEGTYTNVEGLVQAVEAGARPTGESRRDGDIFRAIAAAVGEGKLTGSDHEFEWELQHVVGSLVGADCRVPGAPRELWEDDPTVLQEGASIEGAEAGVAATRDVAESPAEGLVLVPVERLFAGGGTSYFDPGLREVRPAPVAAVHPDDAERLALHAGDRVSVEVAGVSLELEVAVDEAVARGTVQVPSGLPEAPVNRLMSGGRHPRVAVRRLVLEEVV